MQRYWGTPLAAHNNADLDNAVQVLGHAAGSPQQANLFKPLGAGLLTPGG